MDFKIGDPVIWNQHPEQTGWTVSRVNIPGANVLAIEIERQMETVYLTQSKIVMCTELKAVGNGRF